jgi:hypothetical protein
VSVQASAVINIIRDLVPDPTYDSAGNPLPSTDGGLFRAQTLYRFLNDGVKALATKTNWVIEDWTAVPLTQHLPTYDVDSRWQAFDEVFVKGWRLGLATEGYLMWPQKVESGQSLVYALHNTTDHWNLRLFPAPNYTDTVTTLVGALTATSTSLDVVDVTGFLPYGFVQVESELIQYYNLTGTTLSGLVRGVGATAAAAHSDTTPVTHCSGWFKGKRTPKEIVTATDLLEIPLSFQYPLQLFVLSRCAQAQNDDASASALMQQFAQECQQRKDDPKLQFNQGAQVKPYGDPVFGALAWGRAVVS